MSCPNVEWMDFSTRCSICFAAMLKTAPEPEAFRGGVGVEIRRHAP